MKTQNCTNIIYQAVLMKVLWVKEKTHVHRAQNSWGYIISIDYYFDWYSRVTLPSIAWKWGELMASEVVLDQCGMEARE